MKSIKFQNNDMAWEIAALILTPPDFDAKKSYPTIVSVHPFGSCNEQTSSAVYGQALAKQGFVVIAYEATTRANPAAAHAGSRIRPNAWRM
jgi:uncharacterized protein